MSAAEKVRRELRALREAELIGAESLAAALDYVDRNAGEVDEWHDACMSVTQCADLVLATLGVRM